MNQPKIAAIVCQDLKGGIGLTNGDLPWGKHKEDMAFFTQTTQNSVCIMGKNTYQSILKYADKHDVMSPLLRKRASIVVTNDSTILACYKDENDVYHSGHAFAVTSIEKACQFAQDLLKIIKNDPSLGEWSNIFFIGGAQLYKAAAQYVDTLYLNVINREYKADVFFPHDAYKDFKYELQSSTSSMYGTPLADDLVSYTLTKDNNG